MGLVLTTPPTGEPLVLATVKNHLKVDTDLTADDSLITSLITAARMEAEETLWASLLTQTWTATYRGFPSWRDPLQLPRGPVSSVSSVTYLDPSGASQTLSNTLYTLDNRERSDWIGLNDRQFWPATARQSSAVTVAYVAGYGNAAAVPFAICAAMLLRIGDLYRNREAQIIERASAVQNQAFLDLLEPFRRTPDLG